jgi:hypothetical protein
VNLHYGTFLKGEGGDKPLTKYKVICLGPEQRVIGLHAIGKYILIVFYALICACVNEITTSIDDRHGLR